jgi:alpha-glucosidase
MKSISVLYTILLLAATNGVFAQHQNATVSSPDKRIALNILTVGKKLVYNIKAGNIPIINTSSLGLLVDNVDIGDNILMTSTPKTSKINEDYAIIGNHTIAHNRANEAETSLSSAGKKFSLIVRVYNDGVAVHYTIPANTKHIDAERAAWTLPDALFSYK